MSDARQCEFCKSQSKNYIQATEFVVCGDCERTIKELVRSYIFDGEKKPFGVEPVSRDHEPKPGELMYLGPVDQFYKIELRDGKQNSVPIYFQPVPENRPAKPITQLLEELSAGFDQGEFYRITFEEINLQEGETWWDSALYFAPSPSDYDIDFDAEDEDTREPHDEGNTFNIQVKSEIDD